MSVSLGHLKCLMSQNLCNFCETRPTHSEIGCCGVSEIVEAKIRNPSPFHRKFPGFTNRHRSCPCSLRKDQCCIESADLGMLCQHLGTALVSPFLVLRKVRLPRRKSTSDQ